MGKKLRNVVLAGLLLGSGLVISLAGISFMKTASGYAVVESAIEQSADICSPLYARLTGYGEAKAEAVWQVIADTPGGPEAERAFLQWDLLFPLLYGGVLAIIMLVMIRTVGAGRHRAALLAPVALAVIADWTENLIHLRQFARFLAGDGISGWAIGLASAATSVKFLMILASLALIVWLALCFRTKAK
ncbi:hypothetical protein [Hoeflea poritis]|uniref:Uncharacterized protein n=1 Tax=Hoeflea poritis TaxID=2993659 RepID=A0ABT4VPR4_9HYPH|nr:hypothetical protein [Hoeflea poritis]MDA4846150.1 hypothetical protein [Hoeflea poritis]